MESKRRPPETGARQAANKKLERLHIAIDAEWLRMIEKAARRQNLGRSNYIAKVAYAAAVADEAQQ